MSTRELELPAGAGWKMQAVEALARRQHPLLSQYTELAMTDAVVKARRDVEIVEKLLRAALYRELGEALFSDEAVEAVAREQWMRKRVRLQGQRRESDAWEYLSEPVQTQKLHEARQDLKAAWDSATGDLGGEGEKKRFTVDEIRRRLVEGDSALHAAYAFCPSIESDNDAGPDSGEDYALRCMLLEVVDATFAPELHVARRGHRAVSTLPPALATPQQEQALESVIFAKIEAEERAEQVDEDGWPDVLTVGRERLAGRTTEMFLIPPREAADRSASDFIETRRYTPTEPSSGGEER